MVPCSNIYFGYERTYVKVGHFAYYQCLHGFTFIWNLRYGLMMCLAPNNQVPLSLYFKILHNYQLLVYL